MPVDARVGFSFHGCLVYRLVDPRADYYFVVNDGDEKVVKLRVSDAQYSEGLDVLSGGIVAWKGSSSVSLSLWSGGWLRFSKTRS